MSEEHKDRDKAECQISAQICDCESTILHPHVNIGKITAKVPVVLAELSLQINVSTVITFPEPVLEIKDIKKTVKLTQCRLLLPTNQLFVKGFVRKNIQYAAPCPEIEMHTDKSVASDIHSYTVDVPFQCVTEIKKFLTCPVMPEINHRHEFDFLVSKPLPRGFSEKDEIQSKDLSQFHQQSVQHYNELPFCELISSRIIEWDEAIDRRPLPNRSQIGEGMFSKVEEKMVLDLVIKVLQKQQIRVSSTTNDHEDCFDCE
ncbi:DUF3794 domain-containing protein [Cytobacillus firmus]|uniref:CsxC family protein n=1 Tax=Cytobacillus firmus TaxID=1399 RepID=UPI001C9691E5|nr:DUF3794 domain-containing protein [Cytobacillus firmus]MBY6053344.1 DUF3794 domain-containing protein [Cytobacillus firmus]USK41242.1 DUF3794 domain-containing protein [Cytobacillus firmus]